MNTELEDNIKSALSSNPALRDKILALIPAKNSVVTPDTELEKEFVEKGADLEHTRWAKWQAYLHSKCVEHENGKGEWVCFPAELYRRWERQINTPYAELSEVEKESDRKEVRSYLPLLTSRDTYWKERVEAYNELILAVESKCEGETRHQTALRYIKQAEQRPELASEAMCGECLKSMESGAIIYPRRTCPFHATPINEDNLK